MPVGHGELASGQKSGLLADYRIKSEEMHKISGAFYFHEANRLLKGASDLILIVQCSRILICN